MIIEMRKRVLVNTDPQSRCYDGAHFSSKMQWSPWEELERGVSEDRLKFWVELNEYAVSQRGEPARAEFRITEEIVS